MKEKCCKNCRYWSIMGVSHCAKDYHIVKEEEEEGRECEWWRERW